MKIKRVTEMEVEPQELMIGDKITIKDSQWKVLDIQDGRALIWKCTNIKEHVFNEDGSNIYEGSDIQKYLQSEFWEDLPDEMIKVLGEEGFFLLTTDQIREYMPKELDRIVTDEEGYTTWYWTATPYVGYGSYVRYVCPSGYVYYCDAGSSYGVAPACWIHL